MSELLKLCLGKIMFSNGENSASGAADSFNVCEIKYSKDGSPDIKFCDKLKAAELMLRLYEIREQSSDGGSDFLAEFLKSARSVSQSALEDAEKAGDEKDA